MKAKTGKRYTQEIKQSAVLRMMPPNNESVKQISEELGMSEQTPYKWRNEARLLVKPTSGDGRVSEQWQSVDKFLVVMVTYTWNQAERADD